MTERSDSTAAAGAPGEALSGCCILITRARHQAAALAEPLEALGAEVLVAPVIDTVDPEDWGPVDVALGELAGYDWIILTSANAVDRLFRRMQEVGVPVDALSGAKIAVVGPATADRLEDFDVVPDLVPDDYRGEGLLEAFGKMGVGPGCRVLIPRAEKAREILPDGLREAGAHVDVVPVYRTVPAQPEPTVIESLKVGRVDVVTFTSPSTAKHFLAWVESAGLQPEAVMDRIVAASIGPVTSEALRSRGYRVPIEATHSTVTGLVEAVVGYLAVHKARGC
ncbi:MAG: uroporphyrinogen-III synthase [Coriobacteriia bacterium]|nr:uroporphyrinogen-III synthase [Coriobacteriia bacterium]